MAIEVVEIHHHAIRIGSDQPKLDATRDFYEDVLGMKADPVVRRYKACQVSGSISARAARST
jgi:catechol 2,3-dioxygenase-like lactoylglutathione lyase family enzyme